MTRTKYFILIPIFFFMAYVAPSAIFAEDKGSAEIRERLIRIEERMVTREELKAEIKGVREELKAEIKGVREELKDEISSVKNDLKGFLLWGFGVTFAGIFTLIGFVLWDRRTALAPAIQKAKELEEREDRVEKALKEIALKDTNVKEALRHVGILEERA